MARLGRGVPNRLMKPRLYTVGYLATGLGAASATSPETYTDTIPANANCTLIWVAHVSTATNPTITAKVGATSAILQEMLLANTLANMLYLSCFSLLNPPTGSQTITFTTTTGGAVVVNTVHYKNVAAIGTPIVLGQQTGQPSMSASPANPNLLYANAFAYTGTATGNTFTAYNQTQRFLKAEVAGTNQPIVIGDAAGNGSSLTFSATRSNTTEQWGGIIVPLIP